MVKETYKVKCEYPETDIIITKQDIDDIVSKAQNGGLFADQMCTGMDMIGSDGHNLSVSDHLTRGGTLQFRLSDDGRSMQFRMTDTGKEQSVKDPIPVGLHEFMTGFEKWAADNQDYAYLRDDGTIDTSCIDTAAADMILQYAAFGGLAFWWE